MCNHGPNCTNGRLCSWTILNRVVDSMFLLCSGVILCFFLIKCVHELPRGILFHKHWLVELHELFGRFLSCIDRNVGFNKLYKLCGGLLPVKLGVIKLHRLFVRHILRNDWIKRMHKLSSWVVLRNFWTLGSDGLLLGGLILAFFFNNLFKLFIRVIFGLCIFN